MRKRHMRRRVVGQGVVLALVGAVGFVGSAAGAKQHTHSFTQTDLGAAISMHGTAFQTVYKVTDGLNGSGASVQTGTVTGSAFPLSGNDTDTSYFANGVSKTKDTFKLGALDAKGMSAITGSGKCVGGTGIHKLEKCSYTFTGAYDSKTTITKVMITGTDTR